MNKLLIITDITLLESAVNDPDCAIILPDTIQTRNFYNYLRMRGIKSIDLSNIYTVQSFTLMILNNPNLQILPRFLERVITKELILQLHNENPDYAELVNYPEFVSLFLEEFDTLQSNIDLETVNDPKLGYFKKFSMLFNLSLQKLNYSTIRALEKKAAEKINNEGCKYRKLYFAHFFMIDNDLLRLIESLLSHIEVIMFYYDSDSLYHIKERLDRFNAELHRTKREMLQNLQFLAVPDQRSEIITIARKIAEYVQLKNAKFEEFIVAFRDAKLYEPLIREIFSRYNIPYFIEVRQRFQDLELYTTYKNIVSTVHTDITQFLDTLIERLEAQKIDKEEYRDSIRFINYLRQFNDYIPSLKTIYEPMTLQQIKNLLNVYIETYTYGNMPNNRNVVKVIDIGNIFFNFPKYLFVGNMKEGVFPRVLESKELLDPLIKSQSGFYYRTSNLDMKNEDYYFDTLLQSSENIIFTYPYRDQKAKREYQSRYLRKLEADQIIKKQEYDPLKFPEIPVFYAKRELLQALIFNKNYLYKDMDIVNELNDIIKVPKMHDIEDKNEVIETLKNKDFTPTELTQYKKCGLSYFYRYILQIKKPEEPLGVTGTGTLYHNILRDYYSDHRDFKELGDLNNEIKPYVSNHLRPFKGEIDSRLLEIVELSVTRRLYNFLSFDRQISRNRVVHDVEYPFAWNIYEHTIIKGRMDRIDYTGSSFVVIDYKYSSSDTLKKQYKEDLAMPIYLTYLRENNMPAMGRYYSIKLNRFRYTPELERNYTKSVYIGSGEDKIDPAQLKDELREYIEKIRSATFEALPSEDCKHCDYYDICAYYLGGEDHGAE
ncbi:MAG: PD-(D/E)XK nuclease family protein [Thermoplasmata archaeon]